MFGSETGYLYSVSVHPALIVFHNQQSRIVSSGSSRFRIMTFLAPHRIVTVRRCIAAYESPVSVLSVVERLCHESIPDLFRKKTYCGSSLIHTRSPDHHQSLTPTLLLHSSLSKQTATTNRQQKRVLFLVSAGTPPLPTS